MKNNNLDISGRELLTKISESGANIIIGDGDHAVAPSYYDKTLSDPQFMAKLSESGYHLYYRETGTEAQPFIDKFASGEITEEEFVQGMLKDGSSYDVPASYDKRGDEAHIREHLVPIIETADKFGIRVIAADVEMTESVTNFTFLLEKYIEEHSPTQEEVDDLVERYNKTKTLTLPNGDTVEVVAPDKQDVLRELETKVFPAGAPSGYARLSKDEDVGDYIARKMEETGTEKVIGTFGAGHIFNPNGIHHNLPGTSVTIVIIPNAEELDRVKRDFEQYSGEDFETSPNAPNFIIDQSTDTVYPTHTAPPELMNDAENNNTLNRDNLFEQTESSPSFGLSL